MPSKREGYDSFGEEPSNCSISDSAGESSNLILGDIVDLDVGQTVCFCCWSLDMKSWLFFVVVDCRLSSIKDADQWD